MSKRSYYSYIDENGVGVTCNYRPADYAKKKMPIISYSPNSEYMKSRALSEYMKTRLPAHNVNIAGGLFDYWVEVTKIVIGVSITKIFSRGAHVFIMYINDPYNSGERLWQEDIMLDASGHYGIPEFRTDSSDVVYPRSQYTVNINNYRRYFEGKNEWLYTYSYIVRKEIAIKIKEEIKLQSQRDWMTCAYEASTVLYNSGLFENIEVTSAPKKLKNYLDSYKPSNDNIEFTGNERYDLRVFS